MRWRVTVAAALLAATLLAGLALRARVVHLCDRVAAPLEQTADAIIVRKAIPLDSIASATEIWSNALPFFSALVTHEWLDGVTEGLARAEGFLSRGEDSEALAEIRALLILLKRIEEYDRLSLRNIL